MVMLLSFIVIALLCADVSRAYSVSSLRVPHALTTSLRSGHSSSLWMAASGPRSGGGGSTKIDRRTAQQTGTKSSLKEEIEKDWRLIVHDDTIHTIQQVCEIISRCCPLCSGPRAYEVTLETHMTGAGTVAVANKKIITEYCKSLQVAGLTVSMAPDDEFENDDDGGEADE
jgi:ATP-dependent Clp protease adapter protein ClpS